jgi:hypothetical protein
MTPGVYKQLCRVVSKDSNATACSVQRVEGKAADIAGRDCDKAGCLQGRGRQSALLSSKVADVAARRRAKVGQRMRCGRAAPRLWNGGEWA